MNALNRAWRDFKRWYRRPFRRLKLTCTLKQVERAELRQRFVSILLPTFNRRDYLLHSLPRLLQALEKQHYELLIWDNASIDGTAELLSDYAGERVRVLTHNSNIGINALAELAEMAQGEFLLQLDDDVLGFPEDFVSELLFAYLSVPDMGYLGTNVVSDQFTDGGRLPAERSVRVDHQLFQIDYGAVGGWCTLTDRELYDSVGGFLQRPEETYFWADLDYYRKVGRLGRKRGILLNTEVYHAFRVALREADYQAFLKDAEKRDPNKQELPVRFADESFWQLFRKRFPDP